MLQISHKDTSIRRVVAEVRQRVPGRLISVEDTAPEDPFIITFVPASDGEELCTIRTEGNEPERYDIIDNEKTVPGCLIQGVVWRVKEGLRR